MTADDFRRIALGQRDAIEQSHMGHPDFRADGRIFASLHADMKWGMVKLTPQDQQRFLREAPRAFKPEAGAWGRQGCTAVNLATVDEETLGEAMTLARRNVGVRKPRSPSSERARRTAHNAPRTTLDAPRQKMMKSPPPPPKRGLTMLLKIEPKE